MDFKRLATIVLTLALLGVPLLVIFAPAILATTPEAYIVIVTVVLGIVYQLAANQRVKDAVEEFKRWQIYDYITTGILIFGPLILSYQATIMGYIPAWAAGFGTISFGLLSQFITEKRVDNAITVDYESDDDQGV